MKILKIAAVTAALVVSTNANSALVTYEYSFDTPSFNAAWAQPLNAVLSGAGTSITGTIVIDTDTARNIVPQIDCFTYYPCTIYPETPGTEYLVADGGSTHTGELDALLPGPQPFEAYPGGPIINPQRAPLKLMMPTGYDTARGDFFWGMWELETPSNYSPTYSYISYFGFNYYDGILSVWASCYNPGQFTVDCDPSNNNQVTLLPIQVAGSVTMYEDSAIIGSWYVNQTPVLNNAAGGPIVMTFLANGQYVIGQDGDPLSDPSGQDGMEWGTYSYDGTTLTWNNRGLDTNGGWGLGASGSAAVSVINDVLTFDVGAPDSIAIARVNSASIIGGWQADGVADDQTIVLTVIDGTNYMLSHGNGAIPDPAGQAGIEYGTYTWDEITGAFAFTTVTDTTGVFGISHSTFDNIVISGDTMTISTAGVGPETFTRVTGTALTIDTTPDAILFTDLIDVALDTPVSTEILNITGIDTDTYISITGGEYSLNGGAFTSTAGTAVNGDTLQLRTTSSVNNFTTTDVVVNVGTDGGDLWSVTTLTDTVPDAFAFTNQTDVALSTLIASDTVVVAGLGASSAISITGGEYRINSGAFTSVAGFINNNDTVTVRTTSSASYITPVDVVLTIGGVSDSFTVTTETDTDGGGGGSTNPLLLSLLSLFIIFIRRRVKL